MLLGGVVWAGTLAGVTMPDTVSVGGQSLQLNGMGLREKFYVDVYVGGLYLPQKMTDAAAAIGLDAPKRVVMHFIYDKVTRAQMIETFEEQFGGLSGAATQRNNITKLEAVVPELIRAGEQISFDYVPGQGTTMRYNGTGLVTIGGTEFMKLIWGIFLGPKPPTAALKAGLLGQ